MMLDEAKKGVRSKCEGIGRYWSLSSLLSEPRVGDLGCCLVCEEVSRRACLCSIILRWVGCNDGRSCNLL